MKTMLLFCILVAGQCLYAQTNKQFGIHFVTDVPERKVMPKMSDNFGIGLSFAYSPLRSTRLFIELKANWGVYSMRNLDQTFVFDENLSTQTNVQYTSTLAKYILGPKVMLNRDYRLVRAFITPQIGLANMRTKIVIADPNDEDGCEALDRSTRQKFLGFVYGGEIGGELSLDRLGNGGKTENVHKLVLSFNVLASPQHFEYVNVKYMDESEHGTTVTHNGTDINAGFINVNTNDIHEHKIAEIYHTPFLMYGIHVGYVYNF